MAAENFTIFIKNSVTFTAFGVSRYQFTILSFHSEFFKIILGRDRASCVFTKCTLFSRRNLVEFITKAYLRNCTYHRVHHPLCPVFRLGHIAEEIKENFSTLAYRVSLDCIYCGDGGRTLQNLASWNHRNRSHQPSNTHFYINLTLSHFILPIFPSTLPLIRRGSSFTSGTFSCNNPISYDYFNIKNASNRELVSFCRSRRGDSTCS